MRELVAMLPARISGRPYDDLDADMVAQDAERCVWLVRGPSEKARHLIAALGDSQYSPDQLEIDDAADWVDDDARWKREESRALAQGYHGLRVCGEGLHLNGGTEGLRIKALGTYRADNVPVGDVARAFHAALVKQAGCWQRVPTAALNET